MRNALQTHGLAERGWSAGFDRARRRFGCCRRSKRRVTISRHLTILNDRDAVLDTVLHEIAHALAWEEHGEDCGHDERWRAICVRIGARPERCYRRDEVRTPKPRYQLVIQGTGEVVNTYFRRPRERDWSQSWVRGRKSETLGRLVLVPVPR